MFRRLKKTTLFFKVAGISFFFLAENKRRFKMSLNAEKYKHKRVYFCPLNVGLLLNGLLIAVDLASPLTISKYVKRRVVLTHFWKISPHLKKDGCTQKMLGFLE